jgi:hypothetical protein
MCDEFPAVLASHVAMIPTVIGVMVFVVVEAVVEPPVVPKEEATIGVRVVVGVGATVGIRGICPA